MPNPVEQMRKIAAQKRQYHRNAFLESVKKSLGYTVGEVMTTKVASVMPEQPLQEAARLMAEKNISSLVVIKDNKPIGILTEQDFLRKQGEFVQDICTMNPKSVLPHTPLIQAGHMMIENHFRKLIVVQEELRGIVTQTDICQKLSSFGVDNSLDRMEVPEVKDLMTQDVVKISQESKLGDARKLMGSRGIGCLIVEPGSIITERDYVREYAIDTGCDGKPLKQCCKKAKTIRPETQIFEANMSMIGEGFRRLPVVKDRRLIGLITETDIMRGMLQFIQTCSDK